MSSTNTEGSQAESREMPTASDEVSTQTAYDCSFVYDGLRYVAMGLDLTLTPEELADMVAELVSSGK